MRRTYSKFGVSSTSACRSRSGGMGSKDAQGRWAGILSMTPEVRVSRLRQDGIRKWDQIQVRLVTLLGRGHSKGFLRLRVESVIDTLSCWVSGDFRCCIYERALVEAYLCSNACNFSRVRLVNMKDVFCCNSNRFMSPVCGRCRNFYTAPNAKIMTVSYLISSPMHPMHISYY